MAVQVQVSWAGFTPSSEVDGKIYNFFWHHGLCLVGLYHPSPEILEPAKGKESVQVN